MIALAIVLAVLVLLALAPLGVRFSYDGAVIGLSVQAGPAHIRVLPPKPKKPKKAKKQKPPKQKKQTPSEPKQKKSISFSTISGLIGPFFRLVRDFLNSFRRHLAIRKLKLYVNFGADNPADSAIRYGQAWAAIGAALPLLNSALRIKKQDVRAVYDDRVTGFAVDAEVYVTVFLYELAGMGVKYGIRALKLALPLLKKPKQTTVKPKEQPKESGAEK